MGAQAWGSGFCADTLFLPLFVRLGAFANTGEAARAAIMAMATRAKILLRFIFTGE
jgi:hypothetical protein